MLKDLSTSFQKPVVTMIFATALWGLGMVLTKILLAYFHPLTLLLMQLSASVSIYWMVAIIQRKLMLPQQSRKQNLSTITRHPQGLISPKNIYKYLQLGLPGILEPGLAYILSSFGLTMTTASSASLLTATEPVMTIGIAWVLWRSSSQQNLFDNRINFQLVIFSAIALLGVIFTMGLDPNFNQTSLLGDILIISATACASLYTILSQQGVKYLAPVSLAAIQQSFGLLFVGIIWLLTNHHIPNAELLIPKPVIYLLAMISGIFQYLLPFWLYLTSLQKLSASVAAQFLSLIPVFTMLGACIFLHERLTSLQTIGMFVTLSAVMGIIRMGGHQSVVKV
ncbi:DMT family transporter [Calothrix sp. NIES-3974]|uniref:DMT family transporter n=1 Tax=Calothrix sp. NIES-3974 TaxID=2005462 RepID=UPI000B60341C|nr:DMT family transporter [Calothrix sp. NIES-3974]BAZ05223.1 hypothetical protein NIES3974_18690 [Calothrix sp. NIES-3974]